MIVLKDKADCCGCTTCIEICPVSCITMVPDSEGFCYPVTDVDKCINCNACNRACPVINTRIDYQPFHCSDFYAAQSKDASILDKSSSGGLFSLIAEHWIKHEGVVFGATWVKDKVRHIEVRSVDNLDVLRGSKYVQSSLEGTFSRIRGLLKQGIKVLFSGTPCQVDGLNRFIGKKNPNLLTLEVACHGVPSPLVLKKYIKKLKDSYSSDIVLDFRDKTHGWLQYDVKATDNNGHVLFCENHRDNVYMRGFLHELYSRPSCHECPSKGGSSGADFTLCDFWGIEKVLPDFKYEKGTSLLIANTNFAKVIVSQLTSVAVIKKVSYSAALENNGSLFHSASPHPDRSYFFNKLSSTNDVIRLINNCLDLRFPIRLKLMAKAYITRIKVWK